MTLSQAYGAELALLISRLQCSNAGPAVEVRCKIHITFLCSEWCLSFSFVPTIKNPRQSSTHGDS